MKKIMKNGLFYCLLGLLISGVTAYAVSYNANQIDFKPSNPAWDVSKVDKALDDLYTNRKLGIPVLAGHGSNSYSSSVTEETKITGTLDDSDILSVSNNTFTVKKAGYYLIECVVGSNNNNTNGASYSGYTKLYINGTQAFYIGNAHDNYDVRNHIVNLNVNDTIYATYYGNGGNYQKKSLYKVYYVK